MKVIHIESGLGNQMLEYAEYLAIKKENPEEKIYFETIIYDIPEASNVISQWNGYELENIFRVNVPNVKDLFAKTTWKRIIQDVTNSCFWSNNWAYPEVICKALNKYETITGGKLSLINKCESHGYQTPHIGFKQQFYQSFFGYNIRRFGKRIRCKHYIDLYKHPEKLYYYDERDLYCGCELLFQYRGNNIEEIKNEIYKDFVFPKFTEAKDIALSKIIASSNSVAIHIRRGDRQSSTTKYFTGGYYKRAVNFIKRRIKNPTYIIFSDPDSCSWTKQHLNIIGLKNDDIFYFVDWHNGNQSFRDMQLMSICKHSITSVSSFSWWGAFLIKNLNKIVISPEIEINTNYHC